MSRLFLLFLLLAFTKQQPQCQKKQPGFVLLQTIGQGLFTDDVTGADISANGQFIDITQGYNQTKKTILFENKQGVFEKKGTNLFLIEANKESLIHPFNSFSKDGSKLSITGTQIKLYNPKQIQGLNATNHFQAITKQDEKFIFSELSEDGLLLTASTIDSKGTNRAYYYEIKDSTYSSYIPSPYVPSQYIPSQYIPSIYVPSSYIPSSYAYTPYAYHPQQSKFINPPKAFESPRNLSALHISPNKKYVLSYSHPNILIYDDPIVQLYVRNPKNTNQFLKPVTIIDFITPRYIFGDITNNVIVIVGDSTFRIFTRKQNTDIFIQSQNLDSLVGPITTDFALFRAKISNDQSIIAIGYFGGDLTIFNRNSKNLYEKGQTITTGAFIDDLDFSANLEYIIAGNDLDRLLIYVSCFKDYAKMCLKPNEVSQCLPTFTLQKGSCQCAYPKVLSRQVTDCSSSNSLLGAIAGCCRQDQSWVRSDGGKCIGCSLSLNCERCSKPNYCQTCKSGYSIKDGKCSKNLKYY